MLYASSFITCLGYSDVGVNNTTGVRNQKVTIPDRLIVAYDREEYEAPTPNRTATVTRPVTISGPNSLT